MELTAKPREHGFDEARLERIRKWAGGYVDCGKLPCAMTVIARHGDIVFTDLQGYADTEVGEAITFDHRFRIFSMTKPITAAAAMGLVEEGRLRLDDPVSRYIPAFADTRVLAHRDADIDDTVAMTSPMTIHQLLNHTSGLTYGFFDPESPLAERYQSLDLDMNPNGTPLDEWANDLASVPLAFQPGERWNYGVSTDLLGRIIEIIEERPLSDVLQERFFDPLGMMRTGFAVSRADASTLASLYKVTSKGGMSLMDPGATSGFIAPVTRHHGGGGLVSVAEDYLKFTEMLRRGGELNGVRILSPHSVRLMTSNNLGGDLESMGQPKFGESNFRGIGFGLGMAVVLDPARAHLMTSPGEYFWGGAASTVFWVDPLQDMVVLFLTQLYPSSTYPLREELRALVSQAIVE
ncbi:MAG: serine hydrolase domain-containing protein [Rhodospirillales bacterium]